MKRSKTQTAAGLFLQRARNLCSFEMWYCAFLILFSNSVNSFLIVLRMLLYMGK